MLASTIFLYSSSSTKRQLHFDNGSMLMLSGKVPSALFPTFRERNCLRKLIFFHCSFPMSIITQPALPFFPHSTIISTALSSSTSLLQLKQVHAHILRRYSDRSHSHSFFLELVLSSSRLPPSLDYAISVFIHLHNSEIHICNKFLRELSRRSEPQKTLLVYEKMRREGMGLDRFSFPPLLKAASRAAALTEGREMHGMASKLGFDSDPFVQTGLVAMYSACGKLMDARLMFDRMFHRDVVTWSIMIDGYSRSGHFDDVFELFEEMRRSNVEPDEMILSLILSACGRARNLNYGKTIHEFISENNVVLDPHLQSALVTMYANCGSMDTAQDLFSMMSPKNLVVSTAMVTAYSKLGKVKNARFIFDKMGEKDLVCWSAMISGYAESDQPQEALKLFNEMQVLGVEPDHVTMLSVISACANMGVIDRAKWVHIYVDKNGFRGALSICNALIDMYAKCGSLERARNVFEKMTTRNVISWTSMINACAMHGDASNAIKLFRQMKIEHVEPNAVTFVGVLYACSHAGLVDEGLKFFYSMVDEHKIAPKHEHYGCMVDLFGRAKRVREALEVIETMPLVPNVVIWGSLMAACRIHGEMELGEFAAKRVLELAPKHEGALVFLSNVYAKEKRWENVREVRILMNQKGLSKEKAWSRIEFNEEIHEFLVADRSHKQIDKIYEKLNEVVSELKQIGYSPNIDNVLVDLDEEEKKEVVLWHSEKLALSFGLINDRSSIQIIKNLRICEDCHSFMKLVSKAYKKEIIVRDRTRFHHYKDGACSCKDFW